MFSQNLDQLIENTVYSNAPDEIKNSKPFVREWQFFEERAYPYTYIPSDAYKNSIEQRNTLRLTNGESTSNINWVSIGPTPGYYFDYGNISSRIVTGAYHPNDPNIIYIGPANGGVWKSTDGGINWTPLTDNEVSLSMGAIAIDPVNPDIVYAGTGEATYSGVSYYGRGLLKSTDAGSTWTHITSGLPNSTYFSRLVIRPGHSNELLAAIGNGGLVRSTDAGLTWNIIQSGRCDEVLFSPTGDTAFTIGSGIGFRRSLDGGATFSTFGSTGLTLGTRNHIDLCFAAPANMYAVAYSSSAFRVFRSTDYGMNWAQVGTSVNFLSSQAWYDLYVRAHPQDPLTAFVGTIDIFRTTNGGSTFTNLTNGYSGGYVHVDQHYLFFHPTNPNTLISCNDGGINRSTNNGNSFTNLNENLTLTQFYRIAASPFTPRRILGGTQDNGTQQTYSSLNWAAAFGGDGGEVCFNPFNSNFIIGETQNGGLRRTTNGGTSWVSAMSGITTTEGVAWIAPIIVHPSISGTFYTARQRVFQSTNNGGSWTPISAFVNGSSAVRELALSFSDPNIMFAASGSNVFRSPDGGANFTNVTSGLPGRTITSVYVHPDSSNVVFLTFSGFGTQKVYKSTNTGTSWFSISGNLPDTPVNDIFIYTEDPQNPATYFAATDVGVFLTQDNGARWEELYQGLPNTVIMHLDYSPSIKTIRAGTHGRGVYEAYIDLYIPVELVSFDASVKNNSVNLQWSTATELNNRGFEIERKLKNDGWTTIGFVEGSGTTTETNTYSFNDDFIFLSYEGTVLYRLKQIDYDGKYEYSKTISADVSFIPERLVLHQNYPNPFNPVTTIRYVLPEDGKVQLRIFNSLGQLVDELINDFQSKGSHKIRWHANDFPSGIYFVSLEVIDGISGKSHNEVRKITLLK